MIHIFLPRFHPDTKIIIYPIKMIQGSVKSMSVKHINNLRQLKTN
jgi:hypothetical protein